tara:strand:+ start:846 stop:1298 length:453 start_codon:yes stop_codon:yes gene_type:complete
MEFSNRGKKVIEKLNKVTSWTINGIELGSKNVINNKIGAGLGDKESRRKGAKLAHKTQIESGQMEIFQKTGTSNAAIVTMKLKDDRRLRFKTLIKKQFGTKDFNVLNLEVLFNKFPEYTNPKKAFRRFLEDETAFEFIGFKNKSKRYRIK